jgi:thiol-disulfide isomerase/thioredoxin
MARNKKVKKVKIDKYSKVEPEVSKWTIIGVVGFIVAMVLLVIISMPNNQQKVYNAYKPYVTSTHFTQDHPFFQLTTNKVRNRIEKDEVFILYIGNERCPACVASIGAFQRYFYSEGMDKEVKYIYYLNPQLDPEGFGKLIVDYSQILDVTPQLILFINGEIVLSYQPPQVQNPTDQMINTAVKKFFVDGLKLINE